MLGNERWVLGNERWCWDLAEGCKSGRNCDGQKNHTQVYLVLMISTKCQQCIHAPGTSQDRQTC